MMIADIVHAAINLNRVAISITAPGNGATGNIITWCIRIKKMMIQNHDCCKCGHAITDKDIISINKKLLGPRTKQFMCLKCLAAFFGTTEDVLRGRIEDLKDSGCPLFK